MSSSLDTWHAEFPHCTYKGYDTVYNTYKIIRLYTIQMSELSWWADNGAGTINTHLLNYVVYWNLHPSVLKYPSLSIYIYNSSIICIAAS